MRIVDRANSTLAFNFTNKRLGNSLIIHADCFEWLGKVPENTIHAVVTDPPYGVKEYDADQLDKRQKGKGGIWRLPPDFDGYERSPLPRFTALNEKERQRLYDFFSEWSRLTLRALRPGAHVFIATNSFIAQLLYSALVNGGLEFRGQIIRLVRTLRGGDRPKNAEKEFPDVSSMPRGCFEPWGLFRKPLPSGKTVADCLREYETGGLRRLPGDRAGNDSPFSDVIQSERTPQSERKIADHPSLKPQSILRQLVYVSLPLGKGIVLDPFMGSGSTIAAVESLGLTGIGIEKHAEYFKLAHKSIPQLASISTEAFGTRTRLANKDGVSLTKSWPLRRGRQTESGVL